MTNQRLSFHTLAESCDHSDGVKRSADLDLSHVSAAGALLSSASEMGHWSNRLVNGEIVSMETLQNAWTPAPTGDLVDNVIRVMLNGDP